MAQNAGDPTPMVLSPAHVKAVNRPRRIVAHNDIGTPSDFGMDLAKWLEIHFSLFDEPGGQVDGVVWCLDEGNMAVYPSRVLPMVDYPGLKKWLEAGIDPVRVLVEETHKRGLEAFWSYRLNGRDVNADRKQATPPLKAEHPEWLLDRYHWNFAVPEVRDHKVAILRELAENYDFDGVDIDFSRTPPSLPVGRQWLHRDAMTDLMRKVRRTFREIAARRGRPLLLTARLPASVEGCHYDGLDIETWAREGLLDIVYLGSRAIELDLAGYRRVIGGANIKLLPSLDEYHSTDGYRHPPVEVLRGVYANWWAQGVDGVQTYNWHNVTPEVAAKYGLTHPAPPCQVQGVKEIGDPATLRLRDKTFVLQRRYGELGTTWNYYQNITPQGPLPATLPHDGLPVLFSLYVGDDVRSEAANVSSTQLRLLLSGASEQDVVRVKFNGALLPEPAATGDGWRTFALTPRHLALGPTLVSVRQQKRAPGEPPPLVVEKLEVDVDYKE